MPVALLLTVVASLALLIATFWDNRLAVLLPLGLANIWAMYAVRGRLGPLISSPAYYFSGFMFVMGLFGALLANRLAGAGGTSGANYVLPDDMVALTGNLFLAASVIVLVGAWLGRGEPGRSRGDAAALLDFGDLTRHPGLIVAIGAAEVALLVGASGIGPLLNRPTYLFSTSSSIFETALQMVTLGVLVAVGLVAFGTRGSLRWIAILLIATIAAFFVSLGTRRLALVPILLLFSAVLVRRGRIPVLGSVVAVVASLLSLTLPLTFRSQPTHGLIPHLRSVSGVAFGPEQVETNLNNVFVGFRITALTAFEQSPIPMHYFAVSVSPLPGAALGWPVISRSLRLNAFTPYSAIGEIGNHGFLFAAIYFLALGIVLGLIQRGVSTLLRQGWTRIFAVVILGVLFLFVVQSTEYNLRSTIRYVYLAGGLTLLLFAVDALRGRRAPAEPALRIAVAYSASRLSATAPMPKTSAMAVSPERTAAAQADGSASSRSTASASSFALPSVTAPAPLWESSSAIPQSLVNTTGVPADSASSTVIGNTSPNDGRT